MFKFIILLWIKKIYCLNLFISNNRNIECEKNNCNGLSPKNAFKSLIEGLNFPFKNSIINKNESLIYFYLIGKNFSILPSDLKKEKFIELLTDKNEVYDSDFNIIIAPYNCKHDIERNINNCSHKVFINIKFENFSLIIPKTLKLINIKFIGADINLRNKIEKHKNCYFSEGSCCNNSKNNLDNDCDISNTVINPRNNSDFGFLTFKNENNSSVLIIINCSFINIYSTGKILNSLIFSRNISLKHNNKRIIKIEETNFEELYFQNGIIHGKNSNLFIYLKKIILLKYNLYRLKEYNFHFKKSPFNFYKVYLEVLNSSFEENYIEGNKGVFFLNKFNNASFYHCSFLLNKAQLDTAVFCILKDNLLYFSHCKFLNNRVLFLKSLENIIFIDTSNALIIKSSTFEEIHLKNLIFSKILNILNFNKVKIQSVPLIKSEMKNYLIILMNNCTIYIRKIIINSTNSFLVIKNHSSVFADYIYSKNFENFCETMKIELNCLGIINNLFAMVENRPIKVISSRIIINYLFCFNCGDFISGAIQFINSCTASLTNIYIKNFHSYFGVLFNSNFRITLTGIRIILEKCQYMFGGLFYVYSVKEKYDNKINISIFQIKNCLGQWGGLFDIILENSNITIEKGIILNITTIYFGVFRIDGGRNNILTLNYIKIFNMIADSIAFGIIGGFNNFNLKNFVIENIISKINYFLYTLKSANVKIRDGIFLNLSIIDNGVFSFNSDSFFYLKRIKIETLITDFLSSFLINNTFNFKNCLLKNISSKIIKSDSKNMIYSENCVFINLNFKTEMLYFGEENYIDFKNSTFKFLTNNLFFLKLNNSLYLNKGIFKNLKAKKGGICILNDLNNFTSSSLIFKDFYLNSGGNFYLIGKNSSIKIQKCLSFNYEIINLGGFAYLDFNDQKIAIIDLFCKNFTINSEWGILIFSEKNNTIIIKKLIAQNMVSKRYSGLIFLYQKNILNMEKIIIYDLQVREEGGIFYLRLFNILSIKELFLLNSSCYYASIIYAYEKNEILMNDAFFKNMKVKTIEGMFFKYENYLNFSKISFKNIISGAPVIFLLMERNFMFLNKLYINKKIMENPIDELFNRKMPISDLNLFSVFLSCKEYNNIIIFDLNSKFIVEIECSKKNKHFENFFYIDLNNKIKIHSFNFSLKTKNQLFKYYICDEINFFYAFSKNEFLLNNINFDFSNLLINVLFGFKHSILAFIENFKILMIQDSFIEIYDNSSIIMKKIRIKILKMIKNMFRNIILSFSSSIQINSFILYSLKGEHSIFLRSFNSILSLKRIQIIGYSNPNRKKESILKVINTVLEIYKGIFTLNNNFNNGGVIYFLITKLIITNKVILIIQKTRFDLNFAKKGGVLCIEAKEYFDLLIEKNIFFKNWGLFGGGLYLDNFYEGLILNNKFIKNYAKSISNFNGFFNSMSSKGGAIYLHSPKKRIFLDYAMNIFDNLFISNSADCGGALFSNLNIFFNKNEKNNIFIENYAKFFGANKAFRYYSKLFVLDHKNNALDKKIDNNAIFKKIEVNKNNFHRNCIIKFSSKNKLNILDTNDNEYYFEKLLIQEESSALQNLKTNNNEFLQFNKIFKFRFEIFNEFICLRGFILLIRLPFKNNINYSIFFENKIFYKFEISKKNCDIGSVISIMKFEKINHFACKECLKGVQKKTFKYLNHSLFHSFFNFIINFFFFLKFMLIKYFLFLFK